MPIRNIIGTVVLVGLVMAALNRIAFTRKLIAT